MITKYQAGLPVLYSIATKRGTFKQTSMVERVKLLNKQWKLRSITGDADGQALQKSRVGALFVPPNSDSLGVCAHLQGEKTS